MTKWAVGILPRHGSFPGPNPYFLPPVSMAAQTYSSLWSSIEEDDCCLYSIDSLQNVGCHGLVYLTVEQINNWSERIRNKIVNLSFILF